MDERAHSADLSLIVHMSYIEHFFSQLKGHLQR
jgi:hypothetical protein